MARLRVLDASTLLKLPAYCVILAAQQSAGTYLTFDDRLAAVARKLALGVTEPAAP